MRRFLPDLSIVMLLFALPLVMFWQQTIGGQTLLPTENLYQFEPYATYREVVSAPAVPHNHLLSDLVLQNMQWKAFIRDQIATGEVPLWNPHQFGGIPFMAAGQQSTLYPLSLLYYILPLSAAYGWFTVLNLWLAGAFMYAFIRGLGVGRFGGAVSAVTYQLCGFLIASAVFPMIIGAAVWLPLILLMVEFVIRRQPLFGRASSVPWVVIGAVAFACNIFAGHVEMTIYTGLIAGFYSAGRLLFLRGALIERARRAGWLLALVALGFGLGALQFIPLYEVAESNWRSERNDLNEVLGFAHPPRDVIQFVMPNFYGSPAQHSYFDIFTLSNQPVTVDMQGDPITHTEWGIKNYVEGALYVGILPLVLAVFALIVPFTPHPPTPSPTRGEGENKTGAAVADAQGDTHKGDVEKTADNHAGSSLRTGEHTQVLTNANLHMKMREKTVIKWIFAALTAISMTFMFGLPTYALIYVLPGINQLNSPFRWVFGVTVGVAVLAGFGAHALANADVKTRQRARWVGYALMAGGVLIFAGLLASRLIYPQLEPIINDALPNLAGQGGEVAADRFSGSAMFYSVQVVNAAIFGAMVLVAGVVFVVYPALNPPPNPTLRCFAYEGRGGENMRDSVTPPSEPPAQETKTESLTPPPNPLPVHREGESTMSEQGTHPQDNEANARHNALPSLLYGRGAGGKGAIQFLIVVVIAVDLMIASWGFNPASDPALLDFTPPAVEWLLERQEAGEVFRYTTIDAPLQGHANLLQANMTMRYGLDDIRGYDSIISAQYVDYMRRIQIQPQLDFNRVAPLYLDRLDEIDWTRLNLLNVRYIVTHNEIDLPEAMLTASDPRRFSPQFDLVFESPAVRIYRNNDAYPRVSLLEPLDGQIPGFDTRFVGGMLATITQDTGRERFVDVDINGVTAHWLLVSETYADGWRAFVRPQGGGDDLEQPLDVERVFENLQGVRLSPDDLAALYDDANLTDDQRDVLANGRYTVRLVYSPTTFQVGLFGSLISGALVVFMLGVWLWRMMIGGDEGTTLSRVARNSIAPIVLNLFNRGIDFVFAFVMLRILGPTDAGIYYYAVIVFVWFDIFTNFGLDVFLIRETSRQRDSAGYFFFNTTTLRLGLMIACVPLLLGFLFVRQSFIDPALNAEALLAIGLLYIGLAPGSLSKGLTSLYYAFEKAEYPAAVATVTTINKAVLGLIVLLLGYGIVGLASVSIIVNIVTLVILYIGARQFIRRNQPLPNEDDPTPDDVVNRHYTGRYNGNGGVFRPNPRLMRGMVRESYPLMLNHFLATIFFQIDVVILEAMRGAAIVGKYSVSYRWLLALNIIPAFFTQALLPVMSRQASEDREALRRTYALGIKLLVAVALPVAVAFTFLAEPLTLLLGGQQFLPEGAIALQIMIWSIPIGWMNSLTQYLLIAVDLQRRITGAFIVAVSFNIVTNLIFIPQFGYQAAAITTIFSEMVLFVPFVLLTQGALGRIAWLDLVWRPVIAAGAMFVVMAVGWTLMPIGAVIAGAVAYPVVLFLLNPLSDSEWRTLAPLLPGRLQRLLPV